MASLKIKPAQLIELGFPQNPSISMAMTILQKHYKHHTWEEVVPILKSLVAHPEKFYNHEVWDKVADRLQPEPQEELTEIKLRANPLPFDIFGHENIDKTAVDQMKLAMQLPVAVSGALMPDAHSGYGLPIGGVLAAKNAVIPYGVGVDIGCRMSLSILPITGEDFNKHIKSFERSIMDNTRFGTGKDWDGKQEHSIIDSPVFDQIPILNNMRKKALRQLGTSGSGNHFVEFGIADFPEGDKLLNIAPGKYVALLSHSGSRGMGATIANHYTNVAIDRCLLPKTAKQLAWLDLDTEAGIEYWLAMNLAGDYAEACHHTIHKRILKDLGVDALAVIENHHNFAWKEVHNGEELIVHRKGATPAGKGVLGIIPGSMTALGYIVRGKGCAPSLSSAAHGAGRKWSRSKTKASVTHKSLKDLLAKHQVTLLEGSLDESPMAYKDIDEVMRSQGNLVDVIGSFQPRIVRMDKD
jgi:tRNA-splicing ligase RtcB (3'-phosphate/5'-hydroxy nucleic acid ligase)